MKLWAASLRKARQKRRDFEGFNLMSESSSGAAPDSMLSFNDFSEDDRDNVGSAVERRSLLLKSQSLDMPANNKVGISPNLLSTNSVRRNCNQTLGGYSSGVQNSGVELSEFSASTSTSGYSPAFSNENFADDPVPLHSNGLGAKRNAFKKAVRACYFADGVRHIDYVLAYEEDEEEDPERDPEIAAKQEPEGPHDAQTWGEKKAEKRKVFEDNLRKLGLELEYTEAEHSKTKFVLIHAPFEVLAKQAELMRVKMPVRQNDIKNTNVIDGIVDRFLKKFRFLDFDEKTKKRFNEPEYFTAPFIGQHLTSYINWNDRENFFPAAERSRMVFDFLIRTRYDAVETEKYRIGIDRLTSNGTYMAAYPLHEDIFCGKPDLHETEELNDRQLLYYHWAKPRNFYKYQPLDLIKKYFGSKIGLYFAWLGYYTKVLFPAALVGLLCVVFGVSSLSNDIPSNDICGSDGIGAHVLMCPVCDLFCDFTPLNTSCAYSKLSYVFDNSGTVFFATFMSIWATLFLEGWKRYHSEIAWKWGLLDFEVEEETIRPEFQFKIRNKRLNPVTQEVEPYLPIAQRILRLLGSGFTVVFFLCLVVAFVVGIIIYRTIVMQVFATMDDSYFQSNAVILTSVTSASINLIIILILNYFYSWLALKLTAWECPRTQSEFDNSYTLKVFLFQFINFYSSLFYIAFFKGRLSGVPGNRDRTHRVQIDGHRLEGCDPAGCMVELVIQLAIIMCGKQFFNAFMEIGYPLVMNWFRRWKLRIPETRKQKDARIRREKQVEMGKSISGYVSRYEWDYALNPVYDQFLFDEYLEMVIQFGFVTLFVSAFPLAPLFALLNNILEIRLDAYKFTVTIRRPLATSARNLGMWTTILDGISKVAVLTNALVIAFTSDFVPKVLYLLTHTSLIGYVEDSLSYFDATGLIIKNSDFKNVTVCRFKDYRKDPCSLTGRTPGNPSECDDEYGYSFQWWYVFAARLAFVLIFEHFVFVIKAFVAYVIPDIPTRIVIQLQRERYLARQARIAQDLTSATSTSNGCSQLDNTLSSGGKYPHRLEKAFSQDVDEVAGQPDALYDGSDLVPSKAMRKIMKHRPRPSLSSINSQMSAPDRESTNRLRQYSTTANTNIVGEEEFVTSTIVPGQKPDNIETKRSNSVESFYSCGNVNGSTMNLNRS
ncbi:hypothetical protein QR680_001269 [Steinernema hermaphroditum]|uniref:Anoctamin n=1 Tax=Steinernema hermaphroditum TaxID=289476 RepID=A0AA39GXK0_9BILA|nr:hypothetical protein QR680_001269 [Steinernema hermaphroditum]